MDSLPEMNSIARDTPPPQAILFLSSYQHGVGCILRCRNNAARLGKKTGSLRRLKMQLADAVVHAEDTEEEEGQDMQTVSTIETTQDQELATHETTHE
jgi:hypothetical protein